MFVLLLLLAFFLPFLFLLPLFFRDPRTPTVKSRRQAQAIPTLPNELNEIKKNNKHSVQKCLSTRQQRTLSPNCASMAGAGTNCVSSKPRSPRTQPVRAHHTYAWEIRRLCALSTDRQKDAGETAVLAAQRVRREQSWRLM